MNRKLVLIRHGKTAGNLEKRYVGSTDEPLLENESVHIRKIREKADLLRKEEAAELPADFRTPLRISGEEGGGIPLEQILARLPDKPSVFTSPMKRAIETAGILFPGSSLRIVDGFRECDFGAFEYHNYKELSGDLRYQRWIDSGGKMPFPSGESPGHFRKRSRAAFLSICRNRIPDPEEDAVLVVHGGTIMSIMSGLFGGEYFDYQTENLGGFVMPFPEEL